jgi:hypothetical protein
MKENKCNNCFNLTHECLDWNSMVCNLDMNINFKCKSRGDDSENDYFNQQVDITELYPFLKNYKELPFDRGSGGQGFGD